MSLDGAFLHIVKNELLEILPIGIAKIGQIQQPSRDEIVLTFRFSQNQSVAKIKNPKILFSANAMSARVNLISLSPENPLTPPMFCTILRKHLGNGRLMSITQDGLERALNFDFACINEIGDRVNIRLIIEIMGRTSNIILINADTGKIIDSIKRVSEEISSTRPILPNLTYAPPQKDSSRFCLLDCDVYDVQWESHDKMLLKQLEGISPIFAREVVFSGVTETLLKSQEILLQKSKSQITLVSDLEGRPKDFCFIPITQYGTEMLTSTITADFPANFLLEGFFKEKSEVERLKQRSGNIMKTLNTAYERLLRKIDVQNRELADCKDKERFRIFGDLINANVYKLKKGDTILQSENYETSEPVKIELNPMLTPVQNAQKYYNTYRKLTTAEKKLTEMLSEWENELNYLDTVIDAASRAVSDAEIDEIRMELGKSPRASLEKERKKGGGKKVKKPKLLPPLKFQLTDDGTGKIYELLVGRNNRQNDELTFKIARHDDIWLHTKDIAGSHVILKCESELPSEDILAKAAIIAAKHSKAKDSSRVPVDYTLAKYVKKPSGSKPGFVIFTHNKTLYVNPVSDFLKY
ncbi:MAG: NFACT family protein [Oscillospiraceae bacterium]|nr:NFACT family protein [Oscillospiraceae bacterium]